MYISFKTESAAFYEQRASEEIERILKRIAVEVKNGYTKGSILDINGNHVGIWNLEK